MATQVELESLVSRVTMDIDDFVSKSSAISSHLDRLEQRFVQMGQAIAASSEVAATALSTPLVAAIKLVGSSLGVLEGQIVAFTATLTTLGTSGFAIFSKSLSNIGDFLNSVTAGISTNLPGTATALGGFANDLQLATASVDKSSFKLIGSAFGRIGNFLEQVRRFKDVDTSVIIKPINDVLGVMTSVPPGAEQKFQQLGKMFQGTGTMLNSLQGAGVEKIDKLGTELTKFFGVLNTSAPTADAVGASMAAMAGSTKFLNSVEKVTPNKLGNVATKLGEVFAAFDTIKTSPKKLGAIGEALGKTSSLLRSIQSMDDVQDLTKVSDGLKGFFGSFANAIPTGGLDNFNAASVAVSRTSGLLNATGKLGASATGLAGLDTVAGSIKTLFTNIANAVPVGAEKGFSAASGAISRTSGLLNATSKLSATAGGIGNLDNVSTAIKKHFDMMTGIKINGTAFNEVSLSMSRTSSFLKAAGKADLSKLTDLSTGLETFFGEMGKIDAGKSTLVTESLHKYRTALSGLSRINLANVASSGGVVKTLMAQLSTIPVSANITTMANALSKIGLGMKNMAAAGGGAGLPPAISVTGAGGFGGIPAAAGRATNGVNSFKQALKSMFLASDAAMVGLQRIQMTMLGLGVLGIVQFARTDDALTRTLAHMQDWKSENPGQNRAILQAGMFEISNKSITGNIDLAKGLDILTSSGMNAAMAVNALKIAEDFAVASGMNMEKSTRRLVDVMAATGLDVQDVEQNLNNMTRLSDMVVAVASKYGSTEEQLTQAFTGKFANSLKTMKLSVDDGIALLATYSKFGEANRGAAAGTSISRGLEAIMRQTTGKIPQWAAMMNVSIHDAEGKLRPGIEIIEELASRLHQGDNTQQRTAQLMELGFGSKDITALEPLLRQYESFAAIRKEIAESGGTTSKTANMLRGDLLGQMKILFNSASNIASIFGSRLAPALYLVTSAVSNLAEWFTKLNPAMQNLIVYGSMAFIVFRNFGMVIGLVGFAISVLLIPVSLVATGVMMLYSAFMFLVTIPSTISTAFNYVFMSIWKGMKTVWSYAHSFGKGVYDAFSFAGRGVAILANGLVDTLVWLKKGMESVTLFMSNMVAAFGSVFMSIFSLITVVISLIAVFLLLGPIITVLGTVMAGAFAVIGGVLLTVGMALGQLVALVGAGFVAAWGAFKATAVGAMGAVGGALHTVKDGISDMWSDLKNGTGDFIENTASSLRKLAGFFWNFQQNMAIIWEWLGKNGTQAFKDIADLGFKSIETLVSNIGTLMSSVGQVIGVVLTEAWSSVKRYLVTFFSWIGSNWSNIISDMGTIFGAFVRALASNISMLFGVFGAMIGTFTEQIRLAWTNLTTGYTVEQKVRYILDDRASIIKDEMSRGRKPADIKWAVDKAAMDFQTGRRLPNDEHMADLDNKFFAKKRADVFDQQIKNFKPVGLEVDPSKLKTQGTKLGTDLNKATELNALDWSFIPDVIKSKFTESMKDWVPFSDAFIELGKLPIWKSLGESLNTELPVDAWKQTEKFVKRLMGGGDQGEMGDPLPGKGGPGFQFKQISLERTMIGGPVAENIEFQQLTTMKAMDAKLQIIATAAAGKSGLIPNPDRPVPIVR